MARNDLWWLPLVSAVLGGTLAILGGVISQWITSSRQRQERIRDFQRQTLLDVQSDLNHIARAIAHRNDAGESYTNEWRRLTILVERIQNEEIRILVEQFKAQARIYDEDAMNRTFQETNRRIGIILRSL